MAGLISVVIPALNEAPALPALFRELLPVLEGLDCDFEVLFVNDGSTDQTLEILNRAAASDPRIKVLTFPRTFGHQAAITAGHDFCSGDAVIVMDADLQDPPQLLPDMVRLWREGYDVVSPQRVSRAGDGWLKRKTASLFYLTMRKLVDQRIPKEVGDFRLLSRRAVNALRQFREEHRFLRGMIAWLGLREALLPFERRARSAGETKYTPGKMLRFSWTAICSFSALPLRLTMWLGLSTSALGIGYMIWAVYMDLIRHRAVWGWTSIVFLQCLFFGVTLICLSLIGEYVARIYEESKHRPLYVVERAVNLSVAPEEGRRAVVLESRPDGENHPDNHPHKNKVEVNAGRI